MNNESIRNRGCFDCSHRIVCFFLEQATRNLEIARPPRTTRFLFIAEEVGINCQYNDRKLAKDI